MDKALEMGKSSATGSFHLLIGVAGSTIIMAVGTLILAALLNVNELGLYGIALIPSSIINYFRDLGVNAALTQQIASLRAAGKESEIHDVIVSGIVFEIISGAVLALVSFAIAEPLAYILSPANAPALTTYIAIMSIGVFAGALLSAAGGIFVGFERMKLNSFAQILQASVKTALGPFLIVLGFGVFGAIYAAMGSILAGAVVSIIIVYFALFRPLRKCKVGKCDIKASLAPMLKYGIPLTVSSIVVGVVPQVFAFTMAVYAGEWMMGNYYASIYFSVLLSFVSFPIATALFPIFSKLNPEKEPKLVQTVFATSVKYTALLLVPSVMLLMGLATPLVNTLFPKDGILATLFVAGAEPKFPYAPLFLVLTSIVNLFVLFGNISLGTFQTGIGKTKQVMYQSILSLGFGLPLSYFLVAYCAAAGGPLYAILGGEIGTLIAGVPGMTWGLIWIWQKYRVKADFAVSAKIFGASVIASVVSYIFVNIISLPWWVMLASGFVVFMFVFMVSAPLLGAINQTDIWNLKAMLSGLGAVGRVLNFPLFFMKKMCRKENPQTALPET
jgi:O-antigen/teichoic acid export membrane protein